jgi:hypothetical protein
MLITGGKGKRMGISSGEQAERLSRTLSGEENLTTGDRGHNPEATRSPIPVIASSTWRYKARINRLLASGFLGQAPFYFSPNPRWGRPMIPIRGPRAPSIERRPISVPQDRMRRYPCVILRWPSLQEAQRLRSRVPR